MNQKQKLLVGIIPALLAVVIVFVTEQVIQPGYTLKSLVKIMSFMGAILIYQAFTRQKFTDVIRLHKIKNIKPILICMLCFFVGMTMKM